MDSVCLSPKDTLKTLKIYRSIIERQIRYLPLSFDDIRADSRRLIITLNYYIEDYENFFRNKKIKDQNNFEQFKLF